MLGVSTYSLFKVRIQVVVNALAPYIGENQKVCSGLPVIRDKETGNLTIPKLWLPEGNPLM